MKSPSGTTVAIALTWVGTWCSLAALWNLGWIGAPSYEMGVTYQTPRPELFAGLIGGGLIGSAVLVGFAIRRIWQRLPRSGTMHLSAGLLAMGLVAPFIDEVLANDDTEIPVAGLKDQPTERLQTFRLFNLNVLHGYPGFDRQKERYRKLNDIIGHFRADVVVLQEVCNSTEFGNTVDYITGDWNHVYARANGSRLRIGFEEGSALLSRLPIRACQRRVLRPRRPIWENRIALVATLDLGGKERLTVAGVHLSNSDSAGEQAEYLMSAFGENRPDIIVGDFNAELGSRALRALAEGGYSRAAPTKAIHGKNHYNLPHTLAPGPFIDHLFLSDEFQKRWRVDQASWVLTSKPVSEDAIHLREAVSDHDAIVVDLVRK